MDVLVDKFTKKGWRDNAHLVTKYTNKYNAQCEFHNRITRWAFMAPDINKRADAPPCTCIRLAVAAACAHPPELTIYRSVQPCKHILAALSLPNNPASSPPPAASSIEAFKLPIPTHPGLSLCRHARSSLRSSCRPPILLFLVIQHCTWCCVVVVCLFRLCCLYHLFSTLWVWAPLGHWCQCGTHSPTYHTREGGACTQDAKHDWGGCTDAITCLSKPGNPLW